MYSPGNSREGGGGGGGGGVITWLLLQTVFSTNLLLSVHQHSVGGDTVKSPENSESVKKGGIFRNETCCENTCVQGL